MRKHVACVSLTAAAMLIAVAAPAGAMAQTHHTKRDFITLRSHHVRKELFVQRAHNRHAFARAASCPAGNLTAAYCSPPTEQTLFGAYTQHAGSTTFGSTSASDCRALGYSSAPCGVNTTVADELLVAFVSAEGPSTGGQSITVSCTQQASATTACPVTWHKVASENAAGGDSEVWYADASKIISKAAPIFVTGTAAKGGCGSRRTACDVSVQVVSFENAIASGASGVQATGIGASSVCTSPKAAPSCSLITTEPYSQVWAAANNPSAAVVPTWPSNQFAIGVADPTDRTTFYSQFLGTCSGNCSTMSLPSDGLYQNPFALVPTPVPAAGTKQTINDTAPTSNPFNMVDVEIL